MNQRHQNDLLNLLPDVKSDLVGLLVGLISDVVDVSDALTSFFTLERSTSAVVEAFLTDVGNTVCLDSLGLELLDSVRAIKRLANFFECGTAGFDEEEVNGNELDDEQAFEQEVELPTAGFDSGGDGVLVDEQGNGSGKALQEQAVGTNLVAQNLEWVGYVEGDPSERLAFNRRVLGRVVYHAKL